jgi:hypothetical protein
MTDDFYQASNSLKDKSLHYFLKDLLTVKMFEVLSAKVKQFIARMS